jgi:proline iminopeptidase
LERKLKIGASKIEDIFEVLDKYYVYSPESFERKMKTTLNTNVNDIIGKDIMANYDLTNKLELIKDIPILIAQGSHDILTPHLIKNLLWSISHMRSLL